MTVAIVVLASCLALSIAGHVAQGLWLRTANREAADSTALANAERQRAIGLAINNAEHVKYISELEAKVRVQHALLEDARKARADEAVKGIADAPDSAAALARLNAVLSGQNARTEEAGTTSDPRRAEEGALPPLETP